MRVAFSGSRNFQWDEKSRKKLENILAIIKQDAMSIVVGDCHGVDEMVIESADGYQDITVVGAYNKLRRETRCGTNIVVPGNYPARDKYMVDNADYLIAFWDEKSRGTENTIAYAQKLGKKVKVILD